MTGGRFEKQFSNAPRERSGNVVTICPGTPARIVDRLTQFAPLHRRAALRRAQEDAGLSGDLPTIADLRTAEAPPAAIWRLDYVSHGTRPTPQAVQRETARVLADTVWRAALPMMPDAECKRQARVIAEDRLTAEWQRPPQEHRTYTNRAEVDAGQVLVDAHGPLLDTLATVLDNIDEHVTGAGLAAADEDTIRALADQQAEQAHAAWRWRTDMAHLAGRPAPTLTPRDRRCQDPGWHRKQLRRTAGLARQHLAAALGTVGRGGTPYADDYSLSCRRDRDTAARAWSDAHEWRPPGGGNGVPMSDIRERSDAARLHRLGAMTRGLDEVAEREGLVPIMITLTLPPEWHPAPATGRRTWTIERGPEATDAELRRRWVRFRARLAKSEIGMLGLRVWEPHKDGCPHAHALLYVIPEQIAEVDRHLKAVCPEPMPGQRVASTLVEIDRTRSRGSTYVMKYLRKTLTPRPTGADAAVGTGEDDHLTGDHHDRTRAMASERGWRRYATLGVHGMQAVWQRLLTTKETEMTGAPVRIVAARAALRGKRWADALEAMGALRRSGAHRLRLGYETETVDLLTGEVMPLLDRYGSPCRKAAWLLDTETDDWRLALSRGGTVGRVQKAIAAQPEAKKSNEISAVTVSDRFQKSNEISAVTVSDRFPKSVQLQLAIDFQKIKKSVQLQLAIDFQKIKRNQCSYS